MRRSLSKVELEVVVGDDHGKNPEDIDCYRNRYTCGNEDQAHGCGAEGKIAEDCPQGQHCHDRAQSAAGLNNLEGHIRQVDYVSFPIDDHPQHRGRGNGNLGYDELQWICHGSVDLRRYRDHEQQEEEREKTGPECFESEKINYSTPYEEDHGNGCQRGNSPEFSKQEHEQGKCRYQQADPGTINRLGRQCLAVLPYYIGGQRNDQKSVGKIVRNVPHFYKAAHYRIVNSHESRKQEYPGKDPGRLSRCVVC